MKNLILLLFCLSLSVPLLAQEDTDLKTMAMRSYQAKDLLIAREQIEAALHRNAASDLIETHYFRGYIYKDLYKENTTTQQADSFRLAAIRSYKKVIELDRSAPHDNPAIPEDANKSLNYLASTLYNDAAFRLDDRAFEEGQAYFETYASIRTFQGEDVSKRRAEFEQYAEVKKQASDDGTDVRDDAKQRVTALPEGTTSESIEALQAKTESLATISERYVYLTQLINDQSLQLTTDDLIQLNYLYGKLCLEMFRMNAAQENPYRYYEQGIEAIDQAIKLDTQFEYVKLATIRKRFEKLKTEVDKQQLELKESRVRKEIEEDENFLALDDVTKALKFYQAGNLLQAKYHIDRALEDDSLRLLPKASYFAGYIYKDLYKLHKLDEIGHRYRLASMDGYFCVLESAGGEKLHEDSKNSLKYLAATIYNDAAFALDTSNFIIGQSLFELYKMIIRRIEPETNLTDRDVEFKLYLAYKYEEILDTLPQWDTAVAAKISDIYTKVLLLQPENAAARYNGYSHAMKSEKFKNQLLADARRENALTRAESKRQRTQLFAMGGGLIMVLLLAGISFRAYRQKQKDNVLIAAQKNEVEEQREQLQEKNKEITDSITYAKRIQEAILPPNRLVKEHLNNSFILYKPKDIVAGDFYWMEVQDEWTVFAAADCTGHGVPGAMVSVVCSNALNRAVREFGLIEPAKILDKTLEIVIERFEKSEEDVKDGMDISLCALNAKTNELQWAGAQNPLWLITQRDIPVLREAEDGRHMHTAGLHLYEVKGDKQPIGKYADPHPFTNHSIQLEPGDSLYIFSDGYPDQFGGPKGKKLKTKAFKEFLLSIQDTPIHDQRKLINQHFETWQGDLEQIDDVCVMGVRV
jgi:serine phosphatase RsbU (regulator of sigma subunit)/uncharacterized protein YozE (UPF0346 family)